MCIAGKGLFRAAEVGEFGGVNAGETDVYLHQSVINIKISILQNNEDGKDEVAKALAKGTKSELVQLIGHTVVLYKQSVNNKRIELPVKR